MYCKKSSNLTSDITIMICLYSPNNKFLIRLPVSHVFVLTRLCLCRRGSSRQSSPSRSGYRCSRPLNRHRWRPHLPAPPSRPAPLRMKTKKTTCDPRKAFRIVRSPSWDSVGARISQYCHRQRHEMRLTADIHQCNKDNAHWNGQ